MSQSRGMSGVEVTISTAVGLAISTALNMILLPLYGYEVTAGQSMSLAVIFTVASLIRGYVLRRVFNRVGRRD